MSRRFIMVLWALIFTGFLRVQLSALESKPSERLSFFEDNYFITGYGTGWEPIDTFYDTNNQVKYQFSIKYLLDWGNGWWQNSDVFNLYFIYTQKHLWNIFDASSPFKESNFKPGIMANFNFDIPVMYKINFIPIVHESNGRDGVDSKSWNRVILTLGLLKTRFFELDASAFYIYPFNLSEYNLDIVDYSGYFELFARISDNVDDPLFQVDYTLRAATAGLTHIVDFKLGIFHLINKRWPKDILLHAQLHYGYLESLETYNDKTARIRLGIGFY